MLNLGVWPIQAVVKVGDTKGDIEEGRNAGCWTVALADASNYTNIDSIEQWNQMTQQQQEFRINTSRTILDNETNAHFVINNIIELPRIIGIINKKLLQGMHP